MDTAGTPAIPPSAPPSAPPPPGYPPVPTDAANIVDVRVTKRLLWVNNACYPLGNVTRVHAHTVRPKRSEAFNKFLLQLALTVVAVGVLGAASDSPSSSVDKEVMQVVIYLAVGFMTYALVRLFTVLLSATYSVLTISTAGEANALLTAKVEGELYELLRQISHAIENPGAEFRMRVQNLAINPKNYTFGDTVNMNGGTGNTGVSK